MFFIVLGKVSNNILSKIIVEGKVIPFKLFTAKALASILCNPSLVLKIEV